MGLSLNIELSDSQLDELAERMLVQAEEKGIAVRLPERRKPFSKCEVVEYFGVSERTIDNWVEAGLLDRIPSCSRVLITAESVRQRGAGER